MMSRNLRKRNKCQINKYLEKTIVEEESSKYSLFDEDTDGFEYERAMLQKIQKGKQSLGEIEEVIQESIPNGFNSYSEVVQVHTRKKASRNPQLNGPNTGPEVYHSKGTSKTGTDTQNAGLSTKSTRAGV